MCEGGASEKAWRDVYKRAQALERGWNKPRFRAAAIKDLRQFLETRVADVPHVGSLARLVRPEMTPRDLFALLVPCERELKRMLKSFRRIASRFRKQELPVFH